MANGTKICRVCGKEYQACTTNRLTPGVFRWKDVACTPECGQEYFRRIMESRNVKTVVEEAEPEIVEEVVVEDVFVSGAKIEIVEDSVDDTIIEDDDDSLEDEDEEIEE